MRSPKWWSVFATVSSLLLSLGESQTILEVEVGESKAIQYSLSTSEIAECYLTFPNGATYELIPNTTIVSSLDSKYSSLATDTSQTCGISIDSTVFSDSGLYLLNIIDSAEVSYLVNYTLRVQERTTAWPSSTLSIVAGQSAYIFLPDVDGSVQNCYVAPPGEDEVSLTYGGVATNDLLQWSPSTTLWCGVEIRDATDSGYWKLTAATNDTHHYYQRILIRVTDSTILEDAITTISSQIGLSVNTTVGRENGSYCQLTDPRGTSGDLTAGQCNFNVTTLTSQHNGIWTATTGLKGSAREAIDYINVTVEAISHIRTGFSQNPVSSGAIDLYCGVDNVTSEICRFVSPSGNNISVTLGVGNDDYAPYYDPEGVYTCGITVREVSSSDYGTWSCYTGNSTDFRIGYITLSNNDTASTSRVTTSEDLVVSDSYTVFSVYNDTLSLSCSAMTSIVYCWFKHPNGSYFSVVPDSTEDQSWTYSGTSFAQGSCGITFEHSSYDDVGTWTCNMGINGRAIDTSVEIQVQVTASALTPVSVEQGDGTASIECAVLNDDTKALSYCRFIRPDGTGINALYADTDSNYGLGGDLTQGSCILDITSVSEVDVGNWVCAGRLETYSSELSATFTISAAPGLYSSCTMIILLGASVLMKTWFARS